MKANEYDKNLIEEFIDWALIHSPDAWWIYDKTDEAIEKFLQQKEE